MQEKSVLRSVSAAHLKVRIGAGFLTCVHIDFAQPLESFLCQLCAKAGDLFNGATNQGGGVSPNLISLIFFN